MNEIAIIIPSLNPDEKLCNLVVALRKAGFSTIILVNDGSDLSTCHFFNQAVQTSGCILLNHTVNQGKGRALKTAFEYILTQCPQIKGAVTVDADGQHSVKDTVACANALCAHPDSLIMGCRQFSEKHIPARSRMGNKFTCKVIKLLCGISLSDTQTGLRGISLTYMQKFIEIKGERFEYEMNMLLAAKENNIPFYEVPIQTIYIDENKTSHFNPLKDSLRIYAVFGKFLLSSLSSSVVDIVLFSLLVILLKSILPNTYIILATAGARIVSSIVNFLINKNTVFHDGSNKIQTVIKYFSLCIIQLALSAFSVNLLFALLSINESVIKIMVDTILFILSFYIQREWVFRKEKK